MIFKAISRGDVWIVDFDPATGHEQQGARPAVVMSSSLMNTALIGLAIVIPGTTRARRDAAGQPLPNHFVVEPSKGNGLHNPTFFMGEQIRSVSVERFINRIGALTPDELFQLEDITILLLDLGPK